MRMVDDEYEDARLYARGYKEKGNKQEEDGGTEAGWRNRGRSRAGAGGREEVKNVERVSCRTND